MREEETTPPGTSVKLPAIRVEGLRSLLVREAGKPLWKLTARSIDVAADGSSTQVTGVSQGIWYRAGQPWLYLKAHSIRLLNSNNNLWASGGLEVRGPQGLLLKTNSARWEQSSKSLVCPEKVSGAVGNWKIESGSVVYRVGTSRLFCQKRVLLVANGVRLAAPSLVADFGKGRVEMGGGVELAFHPDVALNNLPAGTTTTHTLVPGPL